MKQKYFVFRNVDGVMLTEESHSTMKAAQNSFCEQLDSMAYGWLGLYACHKGDKTAKLVEGWCGDEPKQIKLDKEV